MATYTYDKEGGSLKEKRANIDDLDRQSPPEGDGPDVAGFWKGELGRYETEFKPWTERCLKIIRRYRDERDEATKHQVRYNILWSNIQTLHPAIFSKTPQPVVERRYLDADPIGRIASQTLERAVETDLDVADLMGSAEKTVDDYLLCARGQMWCRYEPEYRDSIQLTGKPEEPGEIEGAEPDDEESDGDQQDQPDQEVAWEKVCLDYVYWSDFAHSPARSWPEVWWVARRAWLSREEGVERFGKVFKHISLKRPDQDSSPIVSQNRDRAPKAEVWEIWDKNCREVFFIAPDLPSQILERVPDPLNLQGFFPCPKPLYATLTNDSLVPVPDYTLYQDQAQEIDSLTNRISRISSALKVVGLYAGDVTQLGRILQASVDNTMIAVDNWAAFSEKGGIAGTISMMPIKDLAQVLMQLYDARERSKRDLDEVTGISDIIRGQSSGSQKTATEQRIKGNFASLRLDSRRGAVARFMRDVVAIVGEIIAEHFSPETLIQMTGMLPVIMDEIKSALPSMPSAGSSPAGMAPGQGGGPPAAPGAAPQPALPPPGAPPGMAPPEMGQMMAPPAPPPPDPQQIALQVFAEAMALLRDDKMRTFRIDIETDSTVEADAVMGKEEVAEFMGAIAQFLNGILPAVQAAPQLLTPMGEALKYSMRRFKMGRSVETAFDAAIKKMEEAANQPKGPDPAMALEDAKGKMQMQMMQAQAQMDQQKMQVEMQMAQQNAQMQMALAASKAQNEQAQLQVDRERIEMELVQAREKHQMDMEKMQMQAAAAASAAADRRIDVGAANAA